MTVQIISNPVSGGFSPQRILALETAFRKRSHALAYGHSAPGTAIALADDLSLVCVVGGDGTLRHVVSALRQAKADVPVCAYPAGTVNLLAREAEYPIDPDAFVERVSCADRRRRGFVGRIGEQLFLVCASAGPDSYAVAGVSSRLKRWIGRAAYGAAFLGVLWHWPRPRILLDVDGRRIVCEAFYVAKGRFFAGPWSFARTASINDETLHLVALTRARRRDYARFMWALLRGKPVDRLPGVVAQPFGTLSAASDADVPVQADGDTVTVLPTTIGIHDGVIHYA